VASSSEGIMKRISVAQYFRRPESLRPMELAYGVVREPPAPRYGHQSVVTRLTVLVDVYVRERGLGVVCVSPIDVVLDEGAALVVQPDLLFIARDRLSIVRSRIWGAPDLVVEVFSPRTATRDRTIKLGWYRRYGVRECWLVDPTRRRVEVHEFTEQGTNAPRAYTGTTPMQSAVFPEWNTTALQIFT
jgi:Uma2 family endonuclease